MTEHERNLSRDIKDNQKSLLKKWTVDAPRHTWENNRNIDGKTRGNKFILNTFRYGNYQGADFDGSRGDPKGENVKGWGSWIDDPRKGSKVAPTNSYHKKYAKQRREKYIGPHSATDQGSDFKAINSITVNKFKGPEGRHLLFRRGDIADDLVYEGSKKVPKIMSRDPNPGDMDELFEERELYSKSLTKARSYAKTDPFMDRSEAIYDERPVSELHLDAKQAMYGRSNTKADDMFMDEKRNLANDGYMISTIPVNDIRDVVISNQKYISSGVYDNLERLNRADITQNGKNIATYTKINNLILLNKTIEEYHKEKRPIVRSQILDSFQKDFIKDLVRDGRSETEIFNLIKQVSLCINERIQNYDHTRDARLTLDDLVTQGVRMAIPNRETAFLFKNTFIDARPNSERIAKIKKGVSKNIKMIREISKGGDEMIYDDINANIRGYAPNAPTNIDRNMVMETMRPSEKIQVLKNIPQSHIKKQLNELHDIKTPDREIHMGINARKYGNTSTKPRYR